MVIISQGDKHLFTCSQAVLTRHLAPRTHVRGKLSYWTKKSQGHMWRSKGQFDVESQGTGLSSSCLDRVSKQVCLHVEPRAGSTVWGTVRPLQLYNLHSRAPGQAELELRAPTRQAWCLTLCVLTYWKHLFKIPKGLPMCLGDPARRWMWPRAHN